MYICMFAASIYAKGISVMAWHIQITTHLALILHDDSNVGHTNYSPKAKESKQKHKNKLFMV